MVTEADILRELSSLQILRVPCPRLAAVKTLLVRCEDFFDLFSCPIVSQRLERIFDPVAHENKESAIGLSLGDRLHVVGYLQLLGRALDHKVAVDHFLCRRLELQGAGLQIALDRLKLEVELIFIFGNLIAAEKDVDVA